MTYIMDQSYSAILFIYKVADHLIFDHFTLPKINN